jgi:hypothetical protein
MTGQSLVLILLLNDVEVDGAEGRPIVSSCNFRAMVACLYIMHLCTYFCYLLQYSLTLCCSLRFPCIQVNSPFLIV